MSLRGRWQARSSATRPAYIAGGNGWRAPAITSSLGSSVRALHARIFPRCRRAWPVTTRNQSSSTTCWRCCRWAACSRVRPRRSLSKLVRGLPRMRRCGVSSRRANRCAGAVPRTAAGKSVALPFDTTKLSGRVLYRAWTRVASLADATRAECAGESVAVFECEPSAFRTACREPKCRCSGRGQLWRWRICLPRYARSRQSRYDLVADDILRRRRASRTDWCGQTARSVFVATSDDPAWVAQLNEQN